MRFRVTILQNRLFHYRVGSFSEVKRMLALEDIELRLVHGQASAAEEVRKDGASYRGQIRCIIPIGMCAAEIFAGNPFPQS